MRKINPLVVFIWLILIVFLSLIFYSPLLLFLLFLSSIIPYFLFPSKTWRIYMKYSLITSLLIILFNLLLVQNGKILISFYFINITQDSLIFSLSMVLRFLSIVSSFAIFSSLVSLDEQIQILEKLKIPQKAIVSLALTLRYFPVILEDSKNMMDSLRARGIEFREKKFRERIRERLPLLSSLLLISLERSINIAEALEIKGFPSKKRSKWRDMKLSAKDKIIVSLFLFDIFLSLFYLIWNVNYLGVISSIVPVAILLGRCGYAEI